MNRSSYFFVGFFIIICSGFGLFFWNSNEKSAAALYHTERPEKRTIMQLVQASGTLEAENTVIIGSLVAGRVVKWFADDNDIVKKDQILVELYDGIGTANIEKFKGILAEQRATLAYQEKTFERQKELHAHKFISDDAFDQAVQNLTVARNAVIAAEGDLSIAQQAYDNLFIKSPTDGVVISRKIKVGQMIASVLNPTELFNIAENLQCMKAKIDVDEADVGLVKKGQACYFYVDAFPSRQFESTIGVIRYQSKVVNSVVSFITEFCVNNEDLSLRPGMTVNVDIKVAEAPNTLTVSTKALRVPAASIQRIAQKLSLTYHPLSEEKTRCNRESVWVFEGTGFTQRAITTGARDRQYVEITSGLTFQDTIVTDIPDTATSPLVSQLTQGKIGG